MKLSCCVLLCAFHAVSVVNAFVSIDTVNISAAGNSADATSFGAVSYEYNIGMYEVTNAQYVEFLNTKAATDSLNLYDASMNITRSGSSGNYTYSTASTNHAVKAVSFWSAVRFANWMHNGQGSGDTETGSYTLTTTGITNNTVARNASATWAIPSEDEWYKAAYYDSNADAYNLYATGTNAAPSASVPTSTANSANYGGSVVGGTTVAGAYTASSSPFGTFDQNGNVSEWVETIAGTERYYRGGSYNTSPVALRKTARNPLPVSGIVDNGFRLVNVPEPRAYALFLSVLLCLLLYVKRQR